MLAEESGPIAIKSCHLGATGEMSPVGGRVAMRFRFSHGDRPIDGYTIQRGVGIGGFGEVYYARSDGGKDVAIKVIRSDRYDVELRGVRQCLNLKHPNLIDTYDIRSNDDGDYFLIMEYVKGPSLADVLAEHPNGLPLPEVRRWFEGIAAAVSYLHRHGIVHRDLKPQNIFQEEDVVKVGDYGLSKHITASQQSGHTTTIGTVYYIAPEVGTGTYGQSVDIFAVGVILYEMLTGKKPFDGDSVGQVLMRIATQEPDYEALPKALRPVLERALAKDPAERYQTMDEFRDEFLAATETRSEPAKAKHRLRFPRLDLERHFRFDRARHQQTDQQPWDKILIRAGVTVIVLAVLFNVASSMVGSLLAFVFFLMVVGYYLIRLAWNLPDQPQQRNRPPDDGPPSPPSAAEAIVTERPAAAPVLRPARARGVQNAGVASPPESQRRLRLRDLAYALIVGPFVCFLIAAGVGVPFALAPVDIALVTAWLSLATTSIVVVNKLTSLERLSDPLLARAIYGMIGLWLGALLLALANSGQEARYVLSYHRGGHHDMVAFFGYACAVATVAFFIPWQTLTRRMRERRIRLLWIIAAFVFSTVAAGAAQVYFGRIGSDDMRSSVLTGALMAALTTVVQIVSPHERRVPTVRPVP